MALADCVVNSKVPVHRFAPKTTITDRPVVAMETDCLEGMRMHMAAAPDRETVTREAPGTMILNPNWLVRCEGYSTDGAIASRSQPFDWVSSLGGVPVASSDELLLLLA